MFFRGFKQNVPFVSAIACIQLFGGSTAIQFYVDISGNRHTNLQLRLRPNQSSVLRRIYIYCNVDAFVLMWLRSAKWLFLWFLSVYEYIYIYGSVSDSSIVEFAMKLSFYCCCLWRIRFVLVALRIYSIENAVIEIECYELSYIYIYTISSMPDSKVEMLPLPIMPPYLFRIQFRSRIQMRTNDRVRKGVDLHPPKRFIASHSVSVAFNMAEEHILFRSVSINAHMIRNVF